MNSRTEEQQRKYEKGKEKELRTQKLRKAKKKKRYSSHRERVRQKNWTDYAVDDWDELEDQTEEHRMSLGKSECRKEVDQLAQATVYLITSLISIWSWVSHLVTPLFVTIIILKHVALTIHGGIFR